ncbi:hypothetical protein BD779DRAFT_1125380 [Infundibulicybe gibba]|nr:hypothetical protein BD779DRAFT_1125380 [Infundibulicybe gibba]
MWTTMDTFSFQIALILVLYISLAGRAQDDLCMSSCMESALPDSGCLLSNISCICTSAQFKTSYDQCTISNCSFENAQIAQESHAQQCDTVSTSSVVSSTTPIQSPTGTTSRTLTMSNTPQSSIIIIGSLISSASAMPTPPSRAPQNPRRHHPR